MIDKTVFENKRAAYFTLGCKLNFAETSHMGRLLEDNGVLRAGDGEDADFCIINTCSVTGLADRKCRQAIRRVRRQNPRAKIVVTGCYAQLNAAEVAAIEGVDLVLGAGEKADIVRHIASLGGDSFAPVLTSDASAITSFSPSCSSDDRTRHFLKVQDGCDYRCSYCAIPGARGHSRNGSIASLVAQAEDVAVRGGREIVITGINVGDFGRSTGEAFIDLLRALDRVDGIERYRVSSIEPNLLSDEVIDFMAISRRFAPHFHIPLQSGCDAMLRLMGRRYDTALFTRKVDRIRAILPDAFIGVDVIAGMRGETDDMFEVTAGYVSALDISQLHVFTYSERPGTRALDIPHVVDAAIRRARTNRLIRISEDKLSAFYSRFMGREAPVLFEHARRGASMKGFTANYIRVETPYDEALAGRMAPVILGGWNAGRTGLESTLIR
ncbi:MAG: tRNA (N(6)-L-threonylcarbamoyladenosine(37)-C(2))-methylthiotransferase MtaB [Tannerellaceae bacterium]|jgi:threonylcarbamoyladenosine tRNA methylthiotransferase MtaB|nr:tRNA (N(6)-L-threonylcarbamoyladenosine(37)-C(2))-methylthiotransferase MtaB [Tannerellaceae bacterium]